MLQLFYYIYIYYVFALNRPNRKITVHNRAIMQITMYDPHHGPRHLGPLTGLNVNWPTSRFGPLIGRVTHGPLFARKLNGLLGG